MKIFFHLMLFTSTSILLLYPACYAMNQQNTAACMGQCPYCSFSTTSSQALAEHIKTHINTSENAEIPEPPKKKQDLQKFEDSDSSTVAIKEKPIDDKTSQSSPINYSAIIAEAYKYVAQPDNTTTSNREKSTTSTDNAAGPIFSALSPMTSSDISEQESFSARQERPYKCDTCGTTFTYNNVLTEHMRIHERHFKCDQCDKAFTSQGVLTMHMRTHTGEKPYKCDTCGKTFTRKSHLTDHIRTHTGERPYKCDTCGKTFIYRRNITEHILVHQAATTAKMEIRFLLNQEPSKPTIFSSTDIYYNCPVCKLFVFGLANFLEHKKTHPTSNNL